MVTWSASLSPLRQRSFAWYYASRFTDTLATTMGRVALAFAVLDLTGSATALGQVAAAHTVPMVLLLLFGGVLADRFPRAAVIQVSNLTAAVSQGVLAWLVISGHDQLWLLVLLAALNGAGDAAGFPAMSAMVPQLVTRGELQNANVLLSLSRGGMQTLGPTLGALLVVGVGPGWALAACALIWVLSAAFLIPMRAPPRPPREIRTGTLTDLREGWALFRGTTWLWVVVLAFGFLNAIHVGGWFVLGPTVAEDTIGRAGWGYVLSANALGMLAMTAVLLRVRMPRPLLCGMLGCTALSVPLFLLGARPELVTLLVAAFLAGAGAEVFHIGWTLAMQENIAEDKLSRAYSYDALGSFVAMPVGQLSYGPLGEAFGNRDVLVGSGVAYAAISLLSLASRSVRDLPRRDLADPT